ncbi:glutaminyl-peptide cyclotransferase [Flavobacteriaceae bacterium F89]|uniref:Glutaminyl-peptide cyclotransferase n=1 Tax=Cerina litoralis TaxID=2874477 RepID=A0AAE3EV43_9FLAO|nr:glutaminyl-peptide cyclotransferase [Cerina litoralis]MCG2461080.1 glutaminyl-peptide cyclotransferase [Cerina litoralis]
MHSFKIFLSGSLFFLAAACGGGNSASSQLFEIKLGGNKRTFQQNQTVAVRLQNNKDKVVENVTYSIDGKELPLTDNKLTLDIVKLGEKTLTAKVNYEGQSAEISKKIKVLASRAPELYTYDIVAVYPHDIHAYTQGLEFHNDTLYESTGLRGKSFLRQVDYKTGRILKEIKLDDRYFGEGITILNDKIYQLTWQSGIGFVYDLHSFKSLNTFKYNKSKEGWGLCNDGKKLFKSDGTEFIWILNPDTLAEEDYIETVTNSSIFNRANELEYVDGKIYANVYQKESMMIINAQSGDIEGVVNFGGLKEKVTQHKNLNVLNGVAYSPTRKTFFVTGKNWDKLFEVRIFRKN